jgi:hypothetical protein
MKLIVHIGTEKTGTSSIQNALFENKALLLEKGFYFSQCAGSRNNIQFPLSCMQYDREDEDYYFTNNGIATNQQRAQYYNELKKKFEDEVNALTDIHTVIISSEHFHSLLVDEQEVKTFKDLLGDMFSSIKIVCYLREQVATCISHYSTRIKTGDSDDLSTFIKRCSPQNPYYNYLDLLDRWSAVFGKSNLIVRLFDKRALRNNDIVDDFFYTIKFEYVENTIIRSKAKNESLSYVGQCLLKQINEDSSIRKPLNPIVVEFIHTHYSGSGENIDANTYDELFKQFVELNNDIALKYLSKTPPLFVFAPPTSDNRDENACQIVRELLPLIRLLLTTNVEDSDADTCRDFALKLEQNSIEDALVLMELASKIRPHGLYIKDKIKQYKNSIVNARS